MRAIRLHEHRCSWTLHRSVGAMLVLGIVLGVGLGALAVPPVGAEEAAAGNPGDPAPHIPGFAPSAQAQLAALPAVMVLLPGVPVGSAPDRATRDGAARPIARLPLRARAEDAIARGARAARHAPRPPDRWHLFERQRPRGTLLAESSSH